MTQSRLDVIALTETWHEDSDCVPIKRLRSMGLNVLEVARPTFDQPKRDSVGFINHGGVAVVARTGVALSKISLNVKATTFEYVCTKIYIKGSSRLLVVIYRPGSEHPSADFFSEFNSLLEAVLISGLPVTITGDINIHLNVDGDVHRAKLNDILAAFDLTQHVTMPTHDRGGLLDVVITAAADVLCDVAVTKTGRSDHSLVSWSVNMAPPELTYHTVTCRQWRNFDVDGFIAAPVSYTHLTLPTNREV